MTEFVLCIFGPNVYDGCPFCLDLLYCQVMVVQLCFQETASLPGFALKAPSADETRLDDSVKTKSRRKRALETKKVYNTCL